MSQRFLPSELEKVALSQLNCVCVCGCVRGWVGACVRECHGGCHLRDRYLLMPHGEHLLHSCDSCAGKAVAVLVHFDGLQPFWDRPEGGAVAATGAGQADGHAATHTHTT